MRYTDQGLRDMLAGLRESVALARRRRSELQSQLGTIEAELGSLGKIEAAIAISVEVLTAEQKRREAVEALDKEPAL